MASLAILLLLARFSSSIAVSSNSYISRSIEQQVIATVAPAVVPDVDGQSTQPFLTSPSGSFTAYLRRGVDSAGGLGGDACYVQVQQAGAGGSVWESDCTPVGGADACDLAFSPVGLELFAGGHSLWDTGVDAADPWTLSLDDGGDMKIISKEGVTVWTASGEPWTGQQCGAPLPVSPEPSTDSALPPPSTAGSKLVTPPSATLAGAGTSTDFSSGDQPAPPPVDTLPGMPVQPPVDTAPEQPLAPPPADASPDLPDLPTLPPPPAPDQPLPPPPLADVSPDQPLYPSPPPAPATFGPDTPVAPPFGVPLATPPPGAGDDSSLPGIATPPGEPGSPGGGPFSGPSPAGMPHPHGPAHPHRLPIGASPPLPDALAPGAHGAGAGKQAGVPFGHGQQPEGQGVFGQQPQLLNGEGQALEESSGGWSGSERGRLALFAVMETTALGFVF